MRKNLIYLFLAVFLITMACTNTTEKAETVTIAITKTNDYYSDLVVRNGEHVQWIDLYGIPVDSVQAVLSRCDGLLVTGGEDVYPGLYGKSYDTARCEGFDRYRDSLEMNSIAFALKHRMPVFGVCRGLQILNVALGGTLIIDIPTDFDTLVKHRLKDRKKCYHEVTLVPGSKIFELSGVLSDTVNSSHHQGIEKPGRDLRITAYANDSLPEAIEWEKRDGKGFLMATQWHPERLDPDHPLSKELAKEFLREAAVYHENR